MVDGTPLGERPGASRDRPARRHVRSGPLRAPAARRRRAARARRLPKCASFPRAIRRIAARRRVRPRDRLAMLRARASPNFPGSSSTRARSRARGKSYTVLTLEELRARRRRAAARCCSSAPTRSSDLPTWHRWREIFDARARRRRRAPGRRARRRAAGAARAAMWKRARTRRSAKPCVARRPAPSIGRPMTPQPISATAIRARSRAAAAGASAVAVCSRAAVLAYIDRIGSTRLAHPGCDLTSCSKTAVTALEDIKARDITVLDVRKLTSLYDTLIIASAESNRQVKALAHHVRDKLKEAGAADHRRRRRGSRRMGARRRRRHRRARHAARGARLLQPRRAVDRRRSAARARRVRGLTSPGRAPSAMKLRIVALGHRMPAWVDRGRTPTTRSACRATSRSTLVELKPEPRDRGKHGRRSCSRPKPRALAAACAGATIVALDERGSAVDDARARRAARAMARRGAATSRS